jgi:TetR/AcrR family transcriptional regulator, regulator of cefoperazone and chloramphenicol sensitivity
MATPLEKAHKDPESMKARILAVACRIFGEYGFHGTTTRMIAQEVGIDISTLHYHWGEKKDLYEAVILDINNDLGQKLIDVEKIIHGLPLGERMAIAIDTMTDYFFARPEISNIMLFRYIAKTRDNVDLRVPEFTADIARSMGLTNKSFNSADSMPDSRVNSAANLPNYTPPRAMLEVLAVMNAIHNFISGESFFRPMVNLEREEYIKAVKETLKFVLIPAFVQREGENL